MAPSQGLAELVEEVTKSEEKAKDKGKNEGELRRKDNRTRK